MTKKNGYNSKFYVITQTHTKVGKKWGEYGVGRSEVRGEKFRLPKELFSQWVHHVQGGVACHGVSKLCLSYCV